MTKILTEDVVRDNARDKIGLFDTDSAKSGVGQITTFNQLGFDGVSDKPDGWYLPNNRQDVALVLEAKSSKYSISEQKYVDELQKNMNIVSKQYNKVVGVLYNGVNTRIFRGTEELKIRGRELIQNLDFYLSLYNNNDIDKEKIYTLTARINNSLHFDFGIKNLYHRMIFTACALVAKRFNALMVEGMDYSEFHNAILNSLNKEMRKAKNHNQKLGLLADVFTEIKMNINVDTDDVNEQERVTKLISQFIDWITQISDNINSDVWRGEDVMGIFFNEFNRYKTKSESGQVFTPEHITDFMYRIIDINKDDTVLDAACGSGGFLVKSMANMISEAGGIKTDKAKSIKSNQLYGIEFDREIYALACANMLIHKDGKTNLEQLDTRTEQAVKWMKSISFKTEVVEYNGKKLEVFTENLTSNPVTKVLMNPPFEQKYGCMTIVSNVLSSVPRNTLCAFILPDKKLEKTTKKLKQEIFQNNRLEKIIKLPEKLFSEGVVTSIFVFRSGIPQENREIFACYMEDDGLVNVKNKGRHDIYNKWNDIENYWIDVVRKQSGDKSCQWIKPGEHLSYQLPKKPFSISEADFVKTLMDFQMFEQEIDVKTFKQDILERVMYSSDVEEGQNKISINLNEDK